MHLFLQEVLSSGSKALTRHRDQKSPTHPLRFRSRGDMQLPTEESGKLMAISKALGTRDSYTEGHGHRVGIYAERLAKRLKLTETDKRNIRIGGILHDIGKIGFSDRIFSNEEAGGSGPMNEEIKAHPWIGRIILKNLNFPDPIPDYVYYHHERVDGRGYPCGLEADKIPAGARIISVADCFDAMTTDRPYQRRKETSAALSTLRSISGKVLSAEFVEAFIREIDENGIEP